LRVLAAPFNLVRGQTMQRNITQNCSLALHHLI
jgi:hypothetical protein